MFSAAAGITFGVSLTLVPLVLFGVRLAPLGESMITASSALMSALLGAVPWVRDTPEVVETFSAIVAVAAPGLTALGLVVAAHRTLEVRRAVTVLLFAVAFASFLALPASQALWLVGAAAVCAAALLIPAEGVARVALWALATSIAVDNVATIWRGESERVAEGIESFNAISGLDAPEFWRVATVVLALAPFAVAVMVEDRPSGPAAAHWDRDRHERGGRW